ncbi:MAG: chemotaxis protein CheW [bacterium]
MLEDLIKSGQKEIQVIIFKLGSEEYAVPISCVQEIIMPQKATRIPKSPLYVEGVINLRGNIIPVIDGKKKFLLKDKQDNSLIDKRIMILEVESETTGLIVDNVNEVINLNISEIEPTPIDLAENAEIFCGIGKYNNRLLILINSEKFMAINDEEKKIEAFVKVTEVIKKAQNAA